MMPLHSWVATPVAGAIGWTLVHSFWEGALAAAALGAVLAATRSPRVRYASACSALLLLLVVCGLTFARLAPEEAAATGLRRHPGFPTWNALSDVNFPPSPHAGLAAVVPWLAPIWVIGVCIFYLRQMAGWVSARRMRRRGVCIVPDGWQQELARLSAQLRVSRPVALLESCLADAPLVLGHFRPLILVPVGFLAGLPGEQVEAILLHELAHIRRCDYLVNVLQRSVEALLFYHPAAWWISHVIRTERENCCDDVAVGASGSAHAYAVALAVLEQNRWTGREPAVAATGGNLVKRIRRLLYPGGPGSAWTPLVASTALVVTTAAALIAWPGAPQEKSLAEAQSQAEAAERADAAQGAQAAEHAEAAVRANTAPYMKWLNEDVVYIIADVERAAFLKLNTAEEREKFIEQFWLRRNPKPGSGENEFKKEHYRRIAYGNERFRTALGKPGWQTDRGRMYIVYGPPDEIESHPSGGSQGQPAVPFEDWGYRHIDGLGDNLFVRFIDRTRTGDYQLVPGSPR